MSSSPVAVTYGAVSLRNIQHFKNLLKYLLLNDRFRNVKLGVFRQYQNTKTILKKKNMGQNHFEKRSKFKKFQLSNFTLTWSNAGKVNSIRPSITCSKELQQKVKMMDKLIFKKI